MLTSNASILLKVFSSVFLVAVFLMGFFSWGYSKNKVDKLRFGFLTVGSMLSLLFALNV
ncbi:MAG: hypothetical protein E6X82_03945 [Clostridium sp.]|nr:hypothetical protein [Clostridium sp.]